MLFVRMWIWVGFPNPTRGFTVCTYTVQFTSHHTWICRYRAITYIGLLVVRAQYIPGGWQHRCGTLQKASAIKNRYTVFMLGIFSVSVFGYPKIILEDYIWLFHKVQKASWNSETDVHEIQKLSFSGINGLFH